LISRLYSGGIDYYVTDDGKNESKFRKYGKRFLYFHTSPLVKMAYHFVSHSKVISSSTYVHIYFTCLFRSVTFCSYWYSVIWCCIIWMLEIHSIFHIGLKSMWSLLFQQCLLKKFEK